MNFTRIIKRIAMFVTLFVLAIPILSQTMMTDAEIKQEVEDVIAEWDATYNDADVDGMMTLYSDDVVSIPPGLVMREGADALRADFEWVFDNFNNAQHNTSVIELKVSGDQVIELGEYTMTYTNEDGEEVSESGNHMMVRELIDSEWKIVWEIWNTYPEEDSQE